MNIFTFLGLSFLFGFIIGLISTIHKMNIFTCLALFFITAFAFILGAAIGTDCSPTGIYPLIEQWQCNGKTVPLILAAMLLLSLISAALAANKALSKDKYEIEEIDFDRIFDEDNKKWL